MPSDQDLGQPELASGRPHLVLEELAQRLDQPESHALREPADVVVRLDRRGGAAHRDALDHVGIERPLDEVTDVFELLGLPLEHIDEHPADDLPLLLRVGHPVKRIQKLVRCVDVDQLEPEVVAIGVDYGFGFVFTEQTIVDEDTGEPIANRLGYQHRRNRRIDTARQPTDRGAVADLPPN